jgi:nicotinate-nucleotide adenylyltransferase
MAGLRLGVLGGTFDPPHLGHLILADEACSSLKLDRILWVLTSKPPHKRRLAITPLELRLQMLEAAIAGNPGFLLSRVDIDRTPPHFAVDTLMHLRSQYPGETLVYLMGGDSLRDLPTWHDPGGFLASADELGVMRRPGDELALAELEQKLPGLLSKLDIFEAPLLEISSTRIRKLVAEDGPYRYYLLPAVYSIVCNNRLYRK